MVDQANELREMFQARVSPFVPKNISARVITITSGKGGVGKTNFAVNLALHLSRNGKRVVIIDADFGLANIEILFGIVPRFSLVDVLMGNKQIEDVLTEGPMGIRFVSGGSGLKELANLSDKQMAYLVENFTRLDRIADVILIDTGAGISKSVVNFIKASNETIIVTTPEPTSITDAYALIKTIKEEKSHMPQFKIVLNRVDDEAEGLDIFQKLQKVSERFLTISLVFLGSVPHDQFLVKAVKRQQPALTLFPNCVFSKSIEKIGNQLLEIENKQTEQLGIMSFMKRLVHIFGN